jgi:hypothetical protein
MPRGPVVSFLPAALILVGIAVALVGALRLRDDRGLGLLLGGVGFAVVIAGAVLAARRPEPGADPRAGAR